MLQTITKYSFFFVLLFAFSSCGSDAQSIKIGNRAITTQQCLSAISLEDFDTLNKVSSRKDEPMLKEMIARKVVYIIPNGTVGIVREVKFGKYLFECTLNGDDLRLWVSSEFLQ